MAPGLYKVTINVGISKDVTLAGSANQGGSSRLPEILTEPRLPMLVLGGGAQVKNIFWQTAAGAAIGTAAL